MKLPKYLALVFSGLFCSSLLLAQDPLDYFPHHKGDIWEYWEWEAPITQNIILSDSLGNDGKYYLETTMFETMIVDTVNFNVYRQGFAGPTELLYKLNAAQGESWWVFADTFNYPKVGQVDNVYQDYLFGQPTTIKMIGYYNVSNSESLWTNTDYLASGFGMIREDIHFFPYLYLIRGAIIDSVLYGNVTVPIEKKNYANIPRIITLHQNYPNPFNPTTTIRYELPAADKVELTIFNNYGSVVKKLVAEYQTAGAHKVHFNASGLASGVYFYRLKTSQRVLSKKMMLLR